MTRYSTTSGRNIRCAAAGTQAHTLRRLALDPKLGNLRTCLLASTIFLKTYRRRLRRGAAREALLDLLPESSGVDPIRLQAPDLCCMPVVKRSGQRREKGQLKDSSRTTVDNEERIPPPVTGLCDVKGRRRWVGWKMPWRRGMLPCKPKTAQLRGEDQHVRRNQHKKK